MKTFKYTIGGKEYAVEIGEINEETNLAAVTVNGETFEVQMEQPAEPEKKKVELGQPVADKTDDNPTPAAQVNEANAVKSELPGTITAIHCKVGDEVKAGDTVLVLEAMKMANNIEAGRDGKITAICVSVGQSVLEEEPLFVVE